MAFTGNFVCSTFKQQLLQGAHDFRTTSGDTFKLALYPSTVTFDASTSAYTSTGEVANGNGYVTGGGDLAVPASMPSLTTTVAWTDFDDEVWAASSFTARGAILYNSTPTSGLGLTNPSVVVLDFLADKTSSAGDFSVIFPAPNSSAAIIRIA